MFFSKKMGRHLLDFKMSEYGFETNVGLQYLRKFVNGCCGSLDNREVHGCQEEGLNMWELDINGRGGRRVGKNYQNKYGHFWPFYGEIIFK